MNGVSTALGLVLGYAVFNEGGVDRADGHALLAFAAQGLVDPR